MKKLHYFPFYYLDWLSSSSVVMMTHEEKGLFIDMLARCYNDDGLPDDDSKLQRLFNCNLAVLDSVKKMFFSVDGLLKNEKLEKIKKEQLGIQREKSKAGKASAKARAAKKLQQSTDVQQVLNSVPTEPQQNLTNKTKQNKTEQINLIVPEFIDSELWKDFLNVRKKLKAQNTERALKSIIGKLKDFEGINKGDANKSIEESIMNSWKGVFAPKTQTSHQPQLHTTNPSNIKPDEEF